MLARAPVSLVPDRLLSAAAAAVVLLTLAFYLRAASRPTPVAVVFIGSFALAGACAALLPVGPPRDFFLGASSFGALMAGLFAVSIIGLPLLLAGMLAVVPPALPRPRAPAAHPPFWWGAAAGLAPIALWWAAILGYIPAF